MKPGHLGARSAVAVVRLGVLTRERTLAAAIHVDPKTRKLRVTATAVSGHFNVSLADTGPGIPEHERTRIFDRFHQVDSSLTKAKGGTGLGRPIAKQIVEMHGGNIWVESKIGRDHQRIFSHQTDDDSRFESVLLIARHKGKRIWQHLRPDLDERSAKH